MGKALIIGDVHLDHLSHIPNYLDTQLAAIRSMVFSVVKEDIAKKKLDYVIFLGDLFVHRKPSPYVLLSLQEVLRQVLGMTYKRTPIYILRGNHDSETKADDGITALSLFEALDPNIHVINHYSKVRLWNKLDAHFIPHYEKEDTIEEILLNVKKDDWVFGHFGFDGCINSIGSYDFNIPIEKLKGNVVLGHVHKYKRIKNITILGTPYTTSFNESLKDSYYGTLNEEGDLEILNQTFGGPKHLVVDFDKLEQHKDKIINKGNDCTLLRIMLNPLEDGNQLDIIRKVIDKYKVDWVDIKFKSMMYDKDDISNYSPNHNVFTINESIIEDYVKESKTSIPYDNLMEGLAEIEN